MYRWFLVYRWKDLEAVWKQVDHFTLGLENPNIIDALKDLDIFLGPFSSVWKEQL